MAQAEQQGPQRFDLVGVGSVVLDRIARVARIIGPEEKMALTAEPGCAPFRDHVGGVTLNHLAWASLLGLSVGMVGRGADDPEGAFMRAGMEKLGIDCGLSRSGSSTAVSLIFVDGRGERAIYMSRGANAENDARHLREEHGAWLASAGIVSTEISQLPLEGVIETLEQGRAAGALTVLDVDIPRADALASLGTAQQFERALSLADVVKPASYALEGVVEGEDGLALARALREKLGCRLVAVTEGAAGSALDGRLRPEQEVFSGRAPAPSIGRVRDTTGAGDAFLGGLLAALAWGVSPAVAGRLANACGGACCEIEGAVPKGPRSRARVRALLAANSAGLSEAEQEELAGVVDRLSDAGERLARPGEGRLHPQAARSFLSVAGRELARLDRRISDEQLNGAVALIEQGLSAGGRVQVTGVGKPGHAAHYLAALLSSTGTPAVFLDALETTHGSAGQVLAGDVVIAISNSGGTSETLACVAAVQARGAKVIAVTARPDSALAEAADALLPAPVGQEGGPLGLAPRASVLAQIAVVAALSCELQARSGFDRSDYAERHPAGALGKQARS